MFDDTTKMLAEGTENELFVWQQDKERFVLTNPPKPIHIYIQFTSHYPGCIITANELVLSHDAFRWCSNLKKNAKRLADAVFSRFQAQTQAF